ncbi:DegV family protein [[Mycoplasma] collis]|uniref:DegV family protein n=1 Tax=[Mycoplasma] collis TaxID=2127 RepID=UPI00051C365E|nr:DegV family protein [[Mycoplasma] collis]
MKIAFVIDSSVGLTQENAKKNDLYFLPLYINIDDKEYADGIDLQNEEVFNLINKNSKISTSATPLGQAFKLIEKLENEYDKIIIYPISSKLSSQYSNLKTAFKDNRKVYVVKSNKLTLLTLLDILRFKKNIEHNMEFNQALEMLENNVEGELILVPKYNDYLVKGGRLSPSAATIAKLLKIVPIIELKNGALEKRGKGRIFNKSLVNIYNEIYNKFPTYKTIVLHSNNNEVNEIVDKFKQISKNKIEVFSIPNVIAVHSGPEAVAFSVINITDNEIKEIKKILCLQK